MNTSEAFVAFSVTAGLLTITPGLDTALVLHTAAREGARRALLAGLGICCGVLVWGIAAAAGLSTLLTASKVAYHVLRFAGAGYLLYVGVKLIFCPGRSVSTDQEPRRRERSNHLMNSFMRGFMTNILNPKVGVFYVSFLPQFIPSDAPVFTFSFLFTLIHATQGLIWFTFLTKTAASVSHWAQRAPVARVADRVTGSIFISFGLRLALEKIP